MGDIYAKSKKHAIRKTKNMLSKSMGISSDKFVVKVGKRQSNTKEYGNYLYNVNWKKRKK